MICECLEFPQGSVVSNTPNLEHLRLGLSYLILKDLLLCPSSQFIAANRVDISTVIWKSPLLYPLSGELRIPLRWMATVSILT